MGAPKTRFSVFQIGRLRREKVKKNPKQGGFPQNVDIFDKLSTFGGLFSTKSMPE